MMPTTVTSQDEAEDSQHSSAMTTSPGRYRGRSRQRSRTRLRDRPRGRMPGALSDVTHSNEMRGRGSWAWTGSWTGAPDNSGAANAVGAIVCAIGAASAHG